MAAQIGISRTPVRDALVRLSQDKFIDIIPSKGFCLHIMNEQDIWSTYQARTAVEGYCAIALACRHDTPQKQNALAQMRESMTNMERSIRNEESLSVVLAHDLQFHRALAECVETEELLHLFESLNYRVSYIALDSFGSPGRPLAALAEHRPIYDSIVSCGSSPDIAPYLAVMRHMEASRDIVLEHMSS